MVATYEEFAAEHRSQHLTQFNRWCAVAGNPLAPVAAITALTGRPRGAAQIFALGTAILVVGHLVEGNLPRSGMDLLRHPIWVVRADFERAIATVGAALNHR